MTVTTGIKNKTAQTANNIVPGGEDSATLNHIILSQFGDNLESAQFYMPEDSPFCHTFDELEFTPPIKDFEFMGRNDWAMLAKMAGCTDSRLIVIFEEFDIILTVDFKGDSGESEISHDELEKFKAYLHTYLFRIIRTHMGYLLGINRISQMVLASIEIEILFPLLVNEMGRLFRFDHIALVSYHPEFDSFRVEAECDIGQDEYNFKKQFIKLSETGLARILEDKTGLVGGSGDIGQGILAQRMIRKGLHSFLFAPVFANGELTACLILASKEIDVYDEDALLRMRPICETIGGALRASLHYSRLQQFNSDYSEAQKHFLQLEKCRNFIDITRGVLHAFNNHLALIMGRAQILGQFSGETVSRESLEKGLNIILNASTKASEQIAQLQKYARLKSDDGPDQIQVKGLMEEIIELSMPRWNAVAHGNIEFNVNIDSQINFVGYRKKIKEVLINILMNAVEAEEANGGEISISAESREGMAIILIRDNGIGIAKEEIANVFNPFYSSKANGTGLGLAVSYKIIREHGGKIEVESVPGKGTLVKIFLPVNCQDCISEDENSQAKNIQNAVLVSPNRIQRNLLMGMLEKAGIYVKAAKSLAVAEKMIREDNPDLVILDDNLRDGNAKDYLELLKKNKPEISTCLIGAPADEDELKRLCLMGIDAILIKPFEQSQISGALHNIRRKISPHNT